MGSRLLGLLVTIDGFLVVALGAFGAHGLKTLIAPEAMQTWHTGVRYQMFHVVALLACAFFASTCEAKPRAVFWALVAAALFVLGTLFFSGSLYLLALTQKSWLGMCVPVGGVFFLLGWASLTICLLRR
ncbi:MAG: DUF423 domain-containing protein [Gammaproteobacteria bacterium]|nr:DUF423 domain-containing protein [Gammaproteobacteria bacterium]MBQ0839112.1 DUF423 domain-containing protein [Gammaproteobacteria bacterium]